MNRKMILTTISKILTTISKIKMTISKILKMILEILKTILESVLEKNIGEAIRRILILIIGVLSWVGSIIISKNLTDYHGAVSARYPEAVINGVDIKNRLEDMKLRKDGDIPKVTLWQRNEGNLVMNSRIGTSLKLALITAFGDMTQVYPGSILYGGSLNEEDYEGCVIDLTTAKKLFRSDNVIGMKLMLADKEYVVRGVIKPVHGCTMIVQANASGFVNGEENGVGVADGYGAASGGMATFSCMELSFSNSQNAVTLAMNFIASCGLAQPPEYINGYMYRKLAEWLIHIPIWFIVFWVISKLIARVYKLKASPVLTLLGCLAVIIISIIMFKLSDFYIFYPSGLIPNRWSDFDFWGRQWKEWITSLRERSGMVRYDKEIVLMKKFYFVIVGVILATIAEWATMKEITRKYRV